MLIVCDQANTPIVSVVMVVCNVDRFLAESIESVLDQTFGEFEFIIVDFGSTDNSKAIASHYAAKDSRIRLHEMPNCSLVNARNAACSLAQGQYIAIMDADDVSLPHRLIREIAFMEKHPQVGLVGGATEWIDAAGRSLRIDHFPTQDHEIRSELADRCPFCQPTVLIRREAFLSAGGYRAAFIVSHDYDLFLRIAERFQCANLKEVVLKYRIHPYQVSLRKRTQQSLCKLAAQASASARRNGIPDPLDSVEEITPALLTRLGVTEARQKRDLAFQSWQWIRHMCMAGEYPVALNAALENLRSDLECVERWQIADLHLIVARLYWRQRRFLRSFLAASHAFVTRPVVAGRPLKSWVRWLGLV